MNIPRTASLVVALIILLAALGSVVDGDIKLKKNTGGVQVSDSTIQGDMKVEQNTGGVTLRNNETEGDLKCKSNSPSPAGSGNSVGGDRVGQCEVLIESLFALDLVASSDSGRSDTDNITNDNTPTVVGETCHRQSGASLCRRGTGRPVDSRQPSFPHVISVGRWPP